MKVWWFKKRKSTGSNSSRRPVTDSKKQPIYSYRSVRSSSGRPLNRGETDVPIEKKSSKLLLHLTRYVVGLIVILGTIYLFYLDTTPKIKIRGSVDLLRPGSAYEQKIEQELSSSLLNRSKITMNPEELSEKIKLAFPEILTVKVSIPTLTHRVVVDINLSSPELKLITVNQTYILDERGRVLFAEGEAAPQLNTDNLITINDISNHKIELGKPAITTEQIGFIRELIAQCNNKRIKIDTMTLSPGGSGLSVKFTGNSYLVKFSFLADARQSSGAYFAMRDQLDLEGITPTEYIDVRIPDRAYVK